jgi:inorganic pyrophosphatase
LGAYTSKRSAAASDADLSRLTPNDPESGGYLAVIEATQGSRNKLKYDPALGAFRPEAVLRLGAAFPWCFGFIRGTLADGGDPIDVLVLMDEPVPVTTVVPCRLLGVIEAIQAKNGKRERNDRLVAVATESHFHDRAKALSDVPRKALDEIERFFVSYNAQRTVRFEPLRRRGAARARALVSEAQDRLKRAQR